MTDFSQGVTVIIPTFRRPKGLAIAIESLRGQSAGGRPVEIVVADNDPEGGAGAYVKSIAKAFPHPIIYIHVPTPGVSNARNGAMSLARGRYIIFLDDDMEATEGWMEAFMETSERFGAAITFLPAVAAMPDPLNPHNPYMAPTFSRVMDAPDGYVHEWLGTGGCMLDLDLCQMPSPPFDAEHNVSGGEDDFLFAQLVKAGAKIAWANGPIAHEHVPSKRATHTYIWKRNFAFGQGPAQIESDKGLRGTPGIIKWMIIGVIQTVLYGTLCLGLRLLGRPLYMRYFSKTAQGIGKIFWWDALNPRLYGLSATTETASA